jgi:hypothetical protein
MRRRDAGQSAHVAEGVHGSGEEQVCRDLRRETHENTLSAAPETLKRQQIAKVADSLLYTLPHLFCRRRNCSPIVNPCQSRMSSAEIECRACLGRFSAAKLCLICLARVPFSRIKRTVSASDCRSAAAIFLSTLLFSG